MHSSILRSSFLAVAIAALGACSAAPARAQAPPLKLLQTIPLPGIEGAFDHMDIDVKGQRLFIPAEQAQLVEVVDVKNGKRLRTISSVRWPSTIAYHPQSDEIFVSDREDGSVKVLSGQTYELVKTIKLQKGADNATYDPATQYFYVRYAGANAGLPYTLIGIIDTAKKENIGDIRVESANIQAMVIEPGSGPKRMYADLADKHQIAVIDLQKRAVVATWPTAPECQGPFAGAVDYAHHRLFVGCRMYPVQSQWWMPGRMIVMNTDTGERVATFDAVGGSDEMFFDAASQRIYLQGYEGIADVWKEVDPDHYQLLGAIQGGVHGKTGLLVPELKRYYVTVSRHQDIIFGVQGGKVEEGYIEVYEVQP
jgi:DNA-binding beta-propeller fold protein YncE